MKPTPLVRRLFSLALGAALLVQPALAVSQTPTAPQDWTCPFSDVSEEDWYYPYVAALNGDGLLNGYGDGRFGPSDPVRAGDAILMVLKAAGCGDLEPLQDAHYAMSYAQYAVDQGWLTAEQISVDLNGPISRLTIAQLAAKALGLLPSEADSPFDDVADGYLTALYKKDVVSGVQQGEQLLFQPDASISRGEVSAIVWRVQMYATHIFFRGEYLDVTPGVPVNHYDRSAFSSSEGRMSYAADETAVLGVDVSSHQGEIDWQAVAADGIQFAMVRVGGRYYGRNSGTVFEDSQARANLQGALDAGLEVGAYFFSQATSVQEAQEEAQLALEILRDYPITGPVVFDWENISNDEARTDGMEAADVTAAANAFCSLVAEAGYQPMIYFNQHIAYNLYELDKVTQYPFWLAEYNSFPGFYYDFQMLQYSDSGSVAGISTGVDMDIWFKPSAS